MFHVSRITARCADLLISTTKLEPHITKSCRSRSSRGIRGAARCLGLARPDRARPRQRTRVPDRALAMGRHCIAHSTRYRTAMPCTSRCFTSRDGAGLVAAMIDELEENARAESPHLSAHDGSASKPRARSCSRSMDGSAHVACARAGRWLERAQAEGRVPNVVRVARSLRIA